MQGVDSWRGCNSATMGNKAFCWTSVTLLPKGNASNVQALNVRPLRWKVDYSLK